MITNSCPCFASVSLGAGTDGFEGENIHRVVEVTLGNMASTEMMVFCLLGTSDLSEFCECGICTPWFRRLHMGMRKQRHVVTASALLGSVVMHSSSGTSMSVSSTYHHLALNVPIGVWEAGVYKV